MSTGSRFSRIDSRPLGDWLLDLVSGDVEKQLTTSKLLDRLRSNIAPDVSVEQQWQELDRAIRAAVNRQQFPRRAFIRRLVVGFEASLRNEQSKIQHALELGSAWVDQVDWEQLAAENLSESELDEIVTSMSAHEPPKKLASMPSLHLYLAHGWIFGALGRELLDAEDLLLEQVDGRLSHDVAKWLERIGTAGRAFRPPALTLLDNGKVRYHPWTPAMAAIVGDDLDAIAQIVERLDASDYVPPPPYIPGMPGRQSSQAERRISGALQVLALIGAPARGVPGILERIEALIDDFSPFALEALGAVGADDEAVLEKLIVNTNNPDWTRQAGAILGLAHFPSHAPRAVSALSDSLILFEEVDGDWTYAGDHERVLGSLSAYGADALPAIDVLEELGFFTLKQHSDEAQQSFAHFLGDLGSVASKRALAPFEALITEIYRGDEDELAEDLLDAHRDYVPMLWALRRLRGED